MKNSDFNIIKVRIYADVYLMKNFYSDKCQEQHYERVQNFFIFKCKLIEKITGKTFEQWNVNKNVMERLEIDQLFKLIEKEYNIYSRRWTDAYMTFYIPKTNIELFEWIKTNLKNPYQIMKRSFTLY